MGFFSRLGDRFSDIGSGSSGSSSRSGSSGSSSRSFRFSPMPPPAKYSIRSGIAALKSNSRSNSDTVSIGRQMKSSAPASRSFRLSPMPPPAKYSVRSGIAALKSNSRSNSDTVSIGKQVKNFAPAPLRNYGPAKPSLFASSSNGSRSNPFGSRTLTSQSSAPFGLTRTSGTPFDVRQVSSSQGGISQLSGRSANLSSPSYGISAATSSGVPVPIDPRRSRGGDTVSISSHVLAEEARTAAQSAPIDAPASAPTASTPKYVCKFDPKELGKYSLYGATPKPDAAERSKGMLKACGQGVFDNTLNIMRAAGVARLIPSPVTPLAAGAGALGLGCINGMLSKQANDLLNPHSNKEALDACNDRCASEAKEGNFQHPDCKEVKNDK